MTFNITLLVMNTFAFVNCLFVGGDAYWFAPLSLLMIILVLFQIYVEVRCR